MDNREADHTVLYSLETLIHIVLPQSQALHYTSILNTQTYFSHLQHLYGPLRVYSRFHLATGLKTIKTSPLEYIQCLLFYLVCEVGAQLQHPVPPLLHGNTHTPPTLYRDGAQRVVLWELNHQLDEDIIHRIGSDHLSRS